MILNLDLNPYINKICNVDKINLGVEIKSNFSDYTPGASIVISKLLDAFGETSISTGFLGGFNGERYHQMLLEEGLAHEFVSIKDETKLKLHIKDKGENFINVIDEEPRVIREDAKKLLNLYLNLIKKSEIICGSSDTLPLGLTDEIYFQLISIANENGKKFIMTAKGEELKKGIDANPYMVILDKLILEDLTKLYLQYENEIIKASNYILHRGVEFVVICLPNFEILMLGQEQGFRISSEAEYNDNLKIDLRKISAGFALGISRNYDLDMTLRLAYAFNRYDASENKNEIDISEIKRIMTEVDICSINY